jgi:hypothetical protein
MSGDGVRRLFAVVELAPRAAAPFAYHAAERKGLLAPFRGDWLQLEVCGEGRLVPGFGEVWFEGDQMLMAARGHKPAVEWHCEIRELHRDRIVLYAGSGGKVGPWCGTYKVDGDRLTIRMGERRTGRLGPEHVEFLLLGAR